MRHDEGRESRLWADSLCFVCSFTLFFLLRVLNWSFFVYFSYLVCRLMGFSLFELHRPIQNQRIDGS